VWDSSLEFLYAEDGDDWLGSLTYTGSLAYQRQDLVERSPNMLREEETDNETWTLGLQVGGEADIFSWTLGHTVTVYSDWILPELEYTDNVTSLSIAWQAFDNVSLGVGLDHQIIDTASGEDTNLLTPTAEASASFFEDRIAINVSYGGAMPYRTFGDDTHVVSGSVSGVLIKPDDGLPGVVISVSVADAVDPAGLNRHSSLVFGSIKLTQSATYQ
jgi:hypothetical protein